MIAILSVSLFWLVSLYTSGLRDPRYLDGWILAGGIILQLLLHAAVKAARLQPKSLSALRKLHVFLGYVLIAVFASHSDMSLPDTALEWALWTAFALVTSSGLFGIYLAWSSRAKRGINDGLTADRIPALRAKLAQSVEALVARTELAPTGIGLPVFPYDAWIRDLYTGHLKAFFAGRAEVLAQLTGSQRTLKRLTDEIENLARFVDKEGQEKLETIRTLVVEKDRLDFASVHLALMKGWLYVHVPATYALVVLTIVHVLVVYAFSSGAW